MRNYWGSILVDKYALKKGDPWPKADTGWSQRIWCSHAKWYQNVGELEGGVSLHCVDIGPGAYPPFNEL